MSETDPHPVSPARPSGHPRSAAERFVLPEASPIAPTPQFLEAAESFGLSFEPGEIDRLGLFLALLLASNQLINLTAIRDPAEAWMRHIFDALTLLPLLAELPPDALVADVGSGGGLPGIPLAIVLPQLRFVLIESTGKKAEYLRQIVHRLGLANVRVSETRSEVLARRRSTRPDDFARASFDVVMARAVGRLGALATLTIPLARTGGCVLLIKGQKAEEELAEAAPILRALRSVHTGTVPTPTGRIVVLEKIGPTPDEFP
ncbi:MAG: 16S rRNA (guanine(527)-N(7))-methyltransferase RsmG [Phycisphaeraceae bacterium]|nr:16S rRNA (guanine(527)-N(7))-methyltransferase RsmG [Phycisphaeraceae bacterium]MCW5753894.1 16S rRNA (guanine(527)-N(7))-methyltransferase RsmG [Phycisphaeraceae bacterium]